MWKEAVFLTKRIPKYNHFMKADLSYRMKMKFPDFKFTQCYLQSLWGKESGQLYAPAAAKSLQSCPTLCDPIDGSPPCSPVPGILQARTLEWVAISFSNAWKWKVKVKSLSRVLPLATPRTAAYQAPSFLGFSRQEYWPGLPLPSPGQLHGLS